MYIMPAKHTTKSWIAKAIEIHGNTYDYSKVDYKNKRSNVIIICRIHGPFEQTTFAHLHKTVWTFRFIIRVCAINQIPVFLFTHL